MIHHDTDNVLILVHTMLYDSNALDVKIRGVLDGFCSMEPVPLSNWSGTHFFVVAQGEFCVLKDNVAHCYIGSFTQNDVLYVALPLYELGRSHEKEHLVHLRSPVPKDCVDYTGV